MLLWPSSPPRTILLVKKWRDVAAAAASLELISYIRARYGCHILVFEDDGEDPRARISSRFTRYNPSEHAGERRRGGGESTSMRSPRRSRAHPAGVVDLIVAVGGDGTVLHASGLFQEAMPPTVAIAFGSLGFLTNHALDSVAVLLDRVLTDAPYVAARARKAWRRSAAAVDADDDAGPTSWTGAAARAAAAPSEVAGPQPVQVSLRMRLKVDVYSAGSEIGVTPPRASHVVLNELLLDKGSSPYMASLQAFVDDEPLTAVHADGLIIATQTGSTAYALSAGGSILSPATAAISFVPICPHTLSFRPLLFPDSSVIKIAVPVDARSTPQASFDCRATMLLQRGDFVIIRSSPWPLPLVCRTTAAGDWINSITCRLMWNVRVRQKPLLGAGSADIADSGGEPDGRAVGDLSSKVRAPAWVHRARFRESRLCHPRFHAAG